MSSSPRPALDRTQPNKPGIHKVIIVALKKDGPCTKRELVCRAAAMREGTKDSVVYRAVKQLLDRGLLIKDRGLVCEAVVCKQGYCL